MSPGGIAVVWLLTLACVGWWQNEAGHVDERTAWQTRENKELRAANAAIKTLQETARRDEKSHALALSGIATSYEEGMANAKKQRDADAAAVRSGAIRLRVQYPASIYSIGDTGTAAVPCTGGGDGADGAELPAAITGDLLDLAADADGVTRQLAACQAVIIEDRRLCMQARTNF
jgi:hypothetical protein